MKLEPYKTRIDASTVNQQPLLPPNPFFSYLFSSLSLFFRFYLSLEIFLVFESLEMIIDYDNDNDDDDYDYDYDYDYDDEFVSRVACLPVAVIRSRFSLAGVTH